MTKGAKKYPQCRRWSFTEYSLENYDKFKTLFNTLGETVIRYMVYQGETAPKTGKLHLQGYVEFKTPRRLGGVKKLLESKTLHAVPSKGNAKQNTTYCTKEESAEKSDFPPVILGTPATNGSDSRRTDIDALYTMVSEGASEYDIMDAFPGAYLRYHKAIGKMRELWIEKNLPKWKKIPVSVFYGKTRSGKTRKVFDENPDVYKLSVKSNSVWFDGYHGQKTLLIDDFYGQIKVSYLLQLLDGYKQQVEIKGDHRWAQWDKIFITSNCHPMDWYNGWEKIPIDVADAVGERISEIVEIKREIPVRENRWVKKIVVEKNKKKKRVGASITPNPRHTVTVPSKQDTKSGGFGLWRSLGFVARKPILTSLTKSGLSRKKKGKCKKKVATTKNSRRNDRKNCATSRKL